MSALTIMPGPIPSPLVSSRHVCHCFHGDVKPAPPTSTSVTPFQDEFLFTVLGLFSKSIIGSSTVAIDNKIEQAMDLVKSHLMFAVREEVEVLKEQIRDLVERMSQLEYENGILRAAASTETLALLAQPRQPPPSSSS